MPRWPRPPNLLRLFVGQHIVNGLSVGLGVVAVALVASAIFGFAAGQPATLGAISASISDLPAPWREKAKTLGFGFALALLSTVAIQLALPWPVAALDHDRRRSALSAASSPGSADGRWRSACRRSSRWSSFSDSRARLSRPPFGSRRCSPRGGVAYIAFALLATVFTDASARRLVASESIREFSLYMRAVAGIFDPDQESGGGLWRDDPPAVGAVGAIAVGALAPARSAGGKGRAHAARGLDRHPARRARCAGRRAMRRRAHPADAGGRDGCWRESATRYGSGSLDLEHLSLGAPDHGPSHSAARPSARHRGAQARGGAGRSRGDGPEGARGARRDDLATRSVAQPRPAPGAGPVGRRDGAGVDRRRRPRRLHPETALCAERARARI